jgi:arylsulfatase A-like enzyme
MGRVLADPPFFMRARLTALALVFALAVFAGPRAQPRPGILLITLDTTRADRMGFLGSTRGLTPALDTLARTATVFSRAYAQAPVTTVSHATLLTGTYPASHHVNQFGAPLPASVPYLPELLQRQGYQTAAFVGSLVLDPINGTAPGFDRGFNVYDAGFRLRRPGEDRYQTVERRGDQVVARALAWLADARAPYFAWVHLFDPHDPYDPPVDLKTRFAAAPYDGEIAAVDRLVGRLISAARPGTLIVVAADHGEALGDHGEATHGVFLYDETLHVPLVIRLPDGRGAGVRVPARVRLADVAPTLLQAIGAPVPAEMDGRSLLPLLATAATTEDRPVYAESTYPRQAFGWSPLVSWRADRFLYIRAPKRELYDLVADPAAARNIADTRGRVADGLEGELAQFLARAGRRGRKGRRRRNRAHRSGGRRAARGAWIRQRIRRIAGRRRHRSEGSHRDCERAARGDRRRRGRRVRARGAAARASDGERARHSDRAAEPRRRPRAPAALRARRSAAHARRGAAAG